MSVLAVTGGTGFVGKKLISLGLDAGHEVRALTRRPQEIREGVTWVPGDLHATDALAILVEGADAVIHVAGVTNAPDREGFASGNIAGTANMIAAAEQAGVTRFVHVSSLAAREPGLSLYGWSKAEGDKLVRASALDWVIVCPPAIYGGGDSEMLDLFKLARWDLALLPPGGRMSVIEVSDLGRLLLALPGSELSRVSIDPDDGVPGGWSHQEFAQAIGEAVGRPRITALALPRWVLMLAARFDRALRGSRAKLTPDRVSYFCHPDWVSAPDRRPPSQLWQPQVPTREGLSMTASWYREQRLL